MNSVGWNNARIGCAPMAFSLGFQNESPETGSGRGLAFTLIGLRKRKE
jgi:hypothetical protein